MPRISSPPDPRAAIVDTGPNTAVPLILAALAELGVEPDAVDYLFLTHVHLDHAGGAGALIRALPSATAVVHPRGATHMIDPVEAHRGHARGLWRGAVLAAVWRNPAHCARAHRHRAGRPAVRARRPHFRMCAYAGACAASPGHRRSRREQHLHRRYLRHFLSRVRHGEGTLDHAHHHAHAIRSRSAQGVDRPAHAVPPAPDISDALQRSGPVRTAGQRHV